MELRHLKYFKVIAEKEHFTNAAKELEVSQPYLSNMVKKMESELHCKLFENRGRAVVLTHSGKILLKHTNTILNEFENINLELNELYKEQTGRKIKIGSCSGFIGEPLITEFLSLYPECSIEYKLMNREDIVQSLEKGAIDMAFTTYEMSNKDIESYFLYEDKYILLCSPEHHLANRESVTFYDLCKENFLAIESSEKYERIIDHFSKIGFCPLRKIYEGSSYALKEMCYRLNGLLFYTEKLYSFEKEEKLKKIFLAEDFSKFKVFFVKNRISAKTELIALLEDFMRRKFQA